MYYTELADRTLYFDGDSVFNPDNIIQLQKKYNIKYVEHLTPEIKQFNGLVDTDAQIRIKERIRKLDKNRTIPLEYQDLNILERCIDKHNELIVDMSDDEISDREVRLADEIILFKKFNKFEILQTIIYIVDELERNNVVYGVGRGSATSSYLLYVLGVHDVDAYLYDLDIMDFFHE